MLTYASCMQSTYASCLEMPGGSRQRGSVLLWLALISLLVFVCCFDHLALVVCCCTVLCLVLLSTASSKKRHINHERRLRPMVSARPKAHKRAHLPHRFKTVHVAANWREIKCVPAILTSTCTRTFTGRLHVALTHGASAAGRTAQHPANGLCLCTVLGGAINNNNE